MPTTMSTKNKTFWKKSKSEQRIAIAKDVLAQLKLGFYKADAGTYCEIIKLKNDIEDAPEKLDKVFVALKKQGASCEVCGIGSCFVSLVNLGDKAKTDDFLSSMVEDRDSIDDSSMRILLRKVFAPRQLSLIETAFERDEFNDAKDNAGYEHVQKAKQFGQRYSSDKGRLTAIMNNIVENKGTFIP